MDPFLEGEMWQEFHDRLANQVSAQLMPLVAPKYVALLGKRYVVDRSIGVLDVQVRQPIYPDVHVVKPRRSPTGAGSQKSTLALSEPTAELPNIEATPQLSVEIRDVADRRLVTLIEILSPANKVGDGARDYEERRIDVLRTRTHVLEIDLLRGGKRIQLASEPPEGDYYVYLSRVERRPNTQVWAVDLRDRLPVVPVPLLVPDPDVAFDLQAAVDSCFDLVGYERLLDYSVAPPPPRLGAEDETWVDGVLRAGGLRRVIAR
jgi:hypothetical protein